MFSSAAATTTTFSASILIAMVPIHQQLCCFNGNGERETRRNNRYDVFLSFRGLDVRKGFVDHLYHALTGAGFHVFLDTHHLQRGEDISADLQHAIKVRHPDQAHGSPFAEAFREHERSGKYGAQEIDEWKDTLSATCRLSGWSLQENTNGYEAALVKRVVEDVGKLCKRRTTRL